MKTFLDQNFLLSNKTAEKLYHDSDKQKSLFIPIIEQSP